MWLPLKNFKISITGAKLSHLVRRDKIWDRGSMVEQAKTAFLQLQKAVEQRDMAIVRKYMTVAGYQKLERKMNGPDKSRMKNSALLDIDIIGVHTGNHRGPDRFKALLKEKERSTAVENRNEAYKAENIFEERWLFIRQGNWWLLNDIKR